MITLLLVCDKNQLNSKKLQILAFFNKWKNYWLI